MKKISKPQLYSAISIFAGLLVLLAMVTYINLSIGDKWVADISNIEELGQEPYKVTTMDATMRFVWVICWKTIQIKVVKHGSWYESKNGELIDLPWKKCAALRLAWEKKRGENAKRDRELKEKIINMMNRE